MDAKRLGMLRESSLSFDDGVQRKNSTGEHTLVQMDSIPEGIFEQKKEKFIQDIVISNCDSDAIDDADKQLFTKNRKHKVNIYTIGIFRTA